MTSLADRLTIWLTRDLVDTARRGLRVFAVTTPSSVAAALAARRLGAPDLALAVGFGLLDAEPEPSLTLGEWGLGLDATARGPSVDTFTALSRGILGVAVVPVQLDSRGATNLSRIGGTDGPPKVALPGSRGLPENNDSPSHVWYVLATHDPRHLVERVDFASGPPPGPDRHRVLLSPLGQFELDGEQGWVARALTPGVSPEDVRGATGFPVTLSDQVPEAAEPTKAELAALDAVDPRGVREVEILPPTEATGRFAQIERAEEALWVERWGNRREDVPRST